MRFVDIYLCTALLRSHYSRADDWPIATTWFFSFFSSHSVFCCAWDDCPISWYYFSQALTVWQIASYPTPEFSSIQRSLRLTQWLRGAWDQWLQNKPKSLVFLIRASLLVWNICAGVLCLELWSNISTSVPEVMWFVQHLRKPKCAAILLRRGIHTCSVFFFLLCHHKV